MTKQKIIETMQKHWHQDGYYTASFDSDDCADELLALFEQEKKEIVERKDRTEQQLLEVQKREIFRAVYYKLLGSGHSYLIKELAKEYGVEL